MERFVYILLWTFLQSCAASPTVEYHYETTYPVTHGDIFDDFPSTSVVRPSTLNLSRGEQSTEPYSDVYTHSVVETSSLNGSLLDLLSKTDFDGYTGSSVGNSSVNGTNVKGNHQFGTTGSDSGALNAGLGVIPNSGNFSFWLNTGFGVIHVNGSDSRYNWSFEQSKGEVVDQTETPIGSEVTEDGLVPTTFDYNAYNSWNEYAYFRTYDYHGYYPYTGIYYG